MSEFIPPSRLAYFNALEEMENKESGSYTRIITDETTVELPRTSQTEITGTPASVSVSFETPSAETVSEYRLTFTAGTNFGLLVTPPEDYTALDVPDEFAAGVLYEMSFVAVDNYIICRCAATQPPAQTEPATP